MSWYTPNLIDRKKCKLIFGNMWTGKNSFSLFCFSNDIQRYSCPCSQRLCGHDNDYADIYSKFCRSFTDFKAGLGIRSFAHRLFAHFAQIKWATVSYSLRSLKTNERLWGNRSGRSEEMSDHERIAQVAQDKWATVSDSLRSLMINEQLSICSKNIWLKTSKILFLVCFKYVFLF